MKLFISMVIAISLIFPIPAQAFFYSDFCMTKECEEDAKEDKKQTLEWLLGLIVVGVVYAGISSSASTDRDETDEIASKLFSQLLHEKPRAWIDSRGQLIVYRW